MGQVTDEILMAYADGELSPEETNALEALLNTDATLRMRLAPFVVTRREIASTFEPTLDEPVPEHLVAAVLRAPTPTRGGTANTASDESWLNRTLAAIGSMLFPQGASLATAASVAVLISVGALGGWLASGSAPATETGLIATTGSGLTASGALAHALESTPSGTAWVGDENGAAIVPVMSFRQTDSNGVCREYRVRNAAAGEADYAGLACRADDGQWRVAVHVETPKITTAQTETGSGAYQTATGPNAPAVDAVADTLISGDALGPDEEKALLENGWRPASS